MKRIFTVAANSHGPGPIFFSWQTGGGNFLVTTGYDHMVNILDRHGEKQDQLRLTGMCSGISWDKDGDILSIICDRSQIITMWDSNSRRVNHVDTGLRDALTFLQWSKTAPLLAVGTSKGNLLIYNHRTSRKVPVLNKHSKQITCGAWSEQNYIALVANDKILTVSNADGDTVCQTNLKADPSLVQFSSMKQDEKSSGENTVSLILNKKSLYLLNIYNPDNPIVLAFQEKYGLVVEYKWYGDGYILLAFSNGFFVVISTLLKEIGQELIQINCHKGNLVHMAACLPQNRIASCSDNIIKIYDLADMKDVLHVITVDEERSLDWLEWTDDGQLLAASGTEGNLHVFLTSLPILGDTNSSSLAVLTSLREVTVIDVTKKEHPIIMNIDVEPTFLALGTYHVAVGMNNRAWFYSLGNKDLVQVQDREYLATVVSMKLNSDYASALTEGKIQLNTIDSEEFESEERESRLFPESDYTNIRITCHALTDEFLIYATDTGALHYFSLADWHNVNDYRHIAGIKCIYPDPSSTRVVVVDDKMDGFLYNPVNDQISNIQDFPSSHKNVLWDSYQSSKGIFLVYNDQKIFVYVYARDTVEGSKVTLVHQAKLSPGQYPLLLYNGEITCQTQSGKTTTLLLNTSMEKTSDISARELEETLKNAIKLKRYKEAWSIASILKEKKHWETLANAALEDLDINFAIRVFRQIEDAGMVWSLKNIKISEDRNFVTGYVAMHCGSFSTAQDSFLTSGKPHIALEMRKILLHWELALQLAEKLDPGQIPFISAEYAQQLEFVGDHAAALLHYEKAIVDTFRMDNLDSDVSEQYNNHNLRCNCGIARMSIRCSDLRRGISYASKINSKTVKKECAEILESIKQLADAAKLYEEGAYFDKAARLYLKLKNWSKVQYLLPHISSPKILGQYAIAKEAEGQYEEAAKSYIAAQDFDNAIRIYVDHLNNLDAAVKLVQETCSVEGAKIVARFFQRLDDIPSAITFLVLSKCKEEAFQLAQSTSKMDVYAEALGDGATNDEYNSIATYYDAGKKHYLAGKYFVKAGQLKKAVRILLQVTGSENNDAIELAIDAAGKAVDEQLTRELIEYLMGETDGIPKDFKHLFRLYMALKQFREAGKTAVIIAREEQNAGNYRNAHDVLFSMYQELKRQNIKIPSEMYSNLMILHSYILIKIHAKIGDHMNSARLLIRISNHISKFPCHIVQILTSAVIECQRAGLKKSAFSFSSMLMRPEYRSKLDVKYKKKIENIVRKPQKDEIKETSSPCPYCNCMVPQSELTCSECRNSLQFCIASGYHIVKDDLTLCPECKFLALYSKFTSLVENEKTCPMCFKVLNKDTLILLSDSYKYLYPQESN